MSVVVRRARHELPTTSSSRPAPQGAVGHDMGSGPIEAGVPVVVDLWPRDNESFCLLRHDAHVRRRRRARRRARVAPAVQGGARPRDLRDPGRRATGRRSSTARCEIFEAAGEPTQRTKEAGRAARRRVLPRARPRCRARGARGSRGSGSSAERRSCRRRRHGRARPLPRRATAACGSRISSWSPRTAPRTSRTSRTTSRPRLSYRPRSG